MADISAKTRIDAAPERVWEVLSDFGGICRATPHITDSSLTSEQAEGIGASRHCNVDMPGVTAEEVVTRWVEGEGYGFDMNMKGMPVRNAHAEFDISVEGEGSVLTGTVSYELPFGALGRAMDKFVSRRMGKMLAGTLAGFKERVESGTEISKETKLAVSEVEIG